MNRKRRKGQRIRTSYIWAGIMSVCALAALFAAVWVVMTVYETIVGDSSHFHAHIGVGTKVLYPHMSKLMCVQTF